MVGCTPRGAVSFVSDCYGGSVSDRQITEDSNILDNSMFDSGDSIMADRGIMVQDLFVNQNVCLIRQQCSRANLNLNQRKLSGIVGLHLNVSTLSV